MARKEGAVNYKNEVLINIVGEILPNGEYGWQAVANAYQEEAKEETIHDTTDLKKHWIKYICNNMKKGTICMHHYCCVEERSYSHNFIN
jgi:hypothetical protein